MSGHAFICLENNFDVARIIENYSLFSVRQCEKIICDEIDEED